MTLTLKDSKELNSTGKPGAPAQENQGQTAPAQRANPVCLEVGVTIQGLPADQGGPDRTIKEEARTVIVFDNGAVLRCSNNLPKGAKVTLTNQRGKNVVCRVAEGRNIPAVKGYVELEFTETIADFWQIHQTAAPVVAPAPPLAPPPASFPVPVTKVQPSISPEVAHPVETLADSSKPFNLGPGSGPSFEDVVGLVRMPSPGKRTPGADPAKSLPSAALRSGATEQSQEAFRSLSLAASGLANSEAAPKDSSKRAASGLSLSTTKSQRPPADFMSTGLLASAPTQFSSGARSGRTGLMLALVLMVAAGAGAGVYFWRAGAISVPDFKALFGRKADSIPPDVATAAPAPVKSSQQVESRRSDFAASAPEENSHQPAPVEAVPEARSEAATSDSRNAQKQTKNQIQARQPDFTPVRPPATPSLKMESPTTRVKILPNPSLDAAPLTDVASAGPASAPPAGLMSATSRLSAPPAPVPALAPALPAPTTPPPAKVSTAPKLISSTRPVYPPAARESNIQGSVTLQATVDERGNVVAVNAVSGPVYLRQAALDSVKQWKYSPATLDGKPISSDVIVSVEFRLR